MIKFISSVLDLNNNFSFLFNGQIMNKYDNRMIFEIFQKVGNNNPMIKICESKGIIGGPSFGKWIQVTMFHLKKKMFLKHKVWKYSPIKNLYNYISGDEFKEMNIFFNGKKLDRNDNNSIASLGINDDFECIIE